MGIPLGWNMGRDEAKEKDVLRADVGGLRSPIRRRRGSRPPRNQRAFDTDALGDGHTSRLANVLEHAPRLSHARTQLPPAPPVPELRERERDVDREELRPRLTPGFAPAVRRSPSPVSDAARPARRSARSPYADDDTATATHAVSHPPLRRVGHRRIADGPLPSSSLRESWSPVSTIDGLGDRERSNSVSSTSSNLPWQTFLSTVVPDPVAPTAESSFASSAASASFAASSSRASSSNSNSAASDRTHVTVPSPRPSPGATRRRRDDMSESFARACESSDEGDSTASDTDDAATANPLSRRRMRPSYFADDPPSPRRYGRTVMDRGIDARRYVRSYYSDATSLYALDGPHNGQTDGPVHGPAADEPHEQDSFATVDDDAAQDTTPASPLDQELRDARSLLERLTRRGDIGDDFWASVGLTRSFADGVERVQDRGRF